MECSAKDYNYKNLLIGYILISTYYFLIKTAILIYCLNFYYLKYFYVNKALIHSYPFILGTLQIHMAVLNDIIIHYYMIFLMNNFYYYII